MSRSFADHMGFNWPKDIAFIVNGEPVTYAALREAKSKAQIERWKFKQSLNPSPVRHAAYVWVFYQPGLFGFAFAGYWLAIRTLRQDWTFSFRHAEYGNGLKTTDMMAMFPLGFLPIKENFEPWKKAFVKRYSHPGRFPKQGLVKGWVTCDYDGGWPTSFKPITA